MLIKDDFIKLGRFHKTHGNNGAIIIKINLDITEIIDNLKFIFVDIDNGLVPFEIIKSSIRNHDAIQVSLFNLETIEKAENLIGKEIYIEMESMPEAQEESIPLQSDIDKYSIYEMTIGELGQIDDILELNNNPLFRLIIDKKEILIPFNEALIERIDHEEKIIYMNLPEGLLDINN